MKYNTKALLTEAVQVKTFIEKNKKIPLSCTLSNNEVISPYSLAYLLSKAIKDNLKHQEYNLINIIIYNPTKKYNDTIKDENVLKDDYLVMIQNFLNFCEKHHRVPRFITTQKSKVKVSFELYLYCMCKIIIYLDKNKTLPNYCNFNKTFTSNANTSNKTSKNTNSQSTSTSKNTNNCTNPYTSKGYLYDDDKGQDTPYGCANNATQQALKKLTGKVFKESKLAKLSGTTTKGTDHQGINTCIAAISKETGIKLTVKWVYFSDLGKTIEERFEALGKIICQPNKAVITHIAYVNGGEKPMTKDTKVYFGHYDGPIDRIDTKRKMVRVISSLGTRRPNGSYTGRVQERSYNVEASYLRYTPGGQKAICIITRG